MQDLSFIIPIRVDTEDRVDNCLTVLRFIQSNFPASEVILMEQDAEIRTSRITRQFPAVRHHFEENPGRFSKARAVNEGLLLASRSLICMCDTDILLHPDALRSACATLRKGLGRVVIPHNRIFIDVSGAFKSEISESLDMASHGRTTRFSDAPTRSDATTRDCNGGIFVAEKSLLLQVGGLNKKMISYGWEDTEFIRRLDKLGHYTYMLPDYNLVHLDHRRGADSKINEMFDINRAEFDKVNAMSRSELEAYVDSDLEIAPIPLRSDRPVFRKRQSRLNAIRLQRLSHLVNKVHVNLQINGLRKLIARVANAN